MPFTITDQNGSAGTTGAGGSGSVVIGDLTGDTGTVILSGDNTYTGNTTVESGTLSISADNDLGADKGALILQSGSTLQATANFTLQHAVEVSGDPTFDVSVGTTLTISTAITDGSSPGDIVVTGGGRMVLAATDTYSGGTTIRAGTLELAAGGSIAGGVTFAAPGATLQLDTSVNQIGGNIAGAILGDGIDLRFQEFAQGDQTVWDQTGADSRYAVAGNAKRNDVANARADRKICVERLQRAGRQ